MGKAAGRRLPTAHVQLAGGTKPLGGTCWGDAGVVVGRSSVALDQYGHFSNYTMGHKSKVLAQ